MQNDKNKNHHQVPHIQTSLEIKFQLKQTVLNFWIKFAEKRHFWSNAEKVNTII